MNYGINPNFAYFISPHLLITDQWQADWILDGGYIPSAIVRVGIRQQLQSRLNEIGSTSLSDAYEKKMNYISLLRTRPIAIETATANEQHYEVYTPRGQMFSQSALANGY